MRNLAVVALLLAAPLHAQTCVAHVDTVSDTLYAVVEGPTPLTPALLAPVARAVVINANGENSNGFPSIGVISLGAGPAGPVLDLRTDATSHTLPATLTMLPGAWAFTLHRDGTVSRAHPVAAPGPVDNLFTSGTIPYPPGATADSMTLHLRFHAGADPTHASAPYAVRRIYVLPIEQQAHALPTNPRPHGTPDTVMAQFAVTTDGLVDTASFYPIRAHAQASIDAVRATLAALRFSPALGTNHCPARTVLSQSFVVRPTAR